MCRTFSYARFSKAMEDISGFGMKDCLSLLELGCKYFKSIRNENHDHFYTYTGKYLSWFVRQSIEGDGVSLITNNINQKLMKAILNVHQKK